MIKLFKKCYGYLVKFYFMKTYFKKKKLRLQQRYLLSQCVLNVFSTEMSKFTVIITIKV